ncbi:MAG: hypothetical protein E4H20_11170, partial [Spirochaetales bacterium]
FGSRIYAQGIDAASGDDLLKAAVPIVYGESAFLERMAARTGGTREAVGLVLSGGSARAFAHIGVLARLEEAGIVPDFIVANSMGSIIGLLYAAGLSPAQIGDLVSRTDIASLFDPVLPLRGGILDPGRFSDLLRSYLGELRLEDLPIPIMIATEDLVTKREIRIAEGDFYTVMEAAYALPVYFPPVAYRGHLLIDGGITNLVPLGMAREYSGRVIVSSTFYDARGLNLRNPLVILNTSIDIGKRRAGVEDLLAYPDALWIRCSVESFSFMAFDSMDALVAEGYRSADAQSDSLAAFQSGGVDPALAAVRTRYWRELPSAFLDWSRFGRAPSVNPVVSMTAAVDSFCYPGDPWFLDDSLFAGVGARFRYGPAQASLAGGYDWQAWSGGNLVPAASASVALYPWPAIELEAVALARWPGDDPVPEVYLRSGVIGAFPWGGGGSRLALASHMEQIADSENGTGARLLTSSARIELDGAGLPGSLGLELGHQFDGPGNDHFAFGSIAVRFAPLPEASLRAGGLTRIGMNAGALAPFYRSDPYLNLDPSSLSGKGQTVAAGSLSAVWEPSWLKLSLGELILVRRVALSVLADGVWTIGADDEPSLVAGLSLACDVSLIGLQSNYLLAQVGLDPRSGEFLARLYLVSR